MVRTRARASGVSAMKPSIFLMLPLLAVMGCTAESQQAPVSSLSPASIGPSSQSPQPSNSLPEGSAVNAPLTGPVGNVGTTRVGPSTVPVRPRY